MSMTILMELKSVQRQFTLGQTRVNALRGVDLQICSGDFMAIWGPSGSGKSTLLNLLGLIDVPTEGTVCFDGQDVGTLNDNALSDCRNHKIGFVFQNFNLIPVLSALENVMLPLQVQGLASAQAAQYAMIWLKRVGLSEFSSFRPDCLSGGQRQRVAIARSLVTEPRLLIADEPTANLDSQTGREVIDLIHALNRETGTTCVFATHDPRLLARVPRHLHLLDGKINEETYQEMPT
jgi:putative ABC transport system ATP-binding protein